MQPSLLVQLTFLLTDALQVSQAGPKVFRTQDAKLLEHRRSSLFIGQHTTAPAVLQKVRLHLIFKKTVHRPRKPLVGVQGRGERETTHGPGSGSLSAPLLAGELEVAFQGGA